MSDFVDLPDLGKHSSRFSPVGKPLILGVLMGILTFFLLVAFFGAPFVWSVIAGFVSFTYVILYFALKKEGIPAPQFYVMKLWIWYSQKRKSNHRATYYQDTTSTHNAEELQKITAFEWFKKLVLYVPFFGLSLKEREPNYKHVADMAGVYGIKENLVKLSPIDWIGFYRITPAINISTTSNREQLENTLQYILNIFNQRQTEIQIFFHKKELRRDNFDVYFNNLRKHKTRGNIERLKHEHIADIERKILNQTLNTFLELTLGVYFTVKPTFLGNNRHVPK